MNPATIQPMTHEASGQWVLGQEVDGKLRPLSVDELRTYLARNRELEELAEKIGTRPVPFGTVEDLYFGAAAPLIDAVLDQVERQLCETLAVSSFSPYESDGGLADGISYNLHSILQAAGAISRQSGEKPLEQIRNLRLLAADTATALLVAGWKDDAFTRRVKLAAEGIVPTNLRIKQLEEENSKLRAAARGQVT